MDESIVARWRSCVTEALSSRHTIARPVSTRRLVGVLGGMGPMATADFLMKIIALTPATCDQEHVPLIVHQVPQIPDRSTSILQGNDAPLPPMLQGLRRLARLGADFAVIPCNSAHYWYEQLAGAQRIQILHIADAVRLELDRLPTLPRRWGILATRGTLRGGIYRRLYDRFGPPLPIYETTQILVDRSIAAIKAGQTTAASLVAREAANRVLETGADILILACTELSIALADATTQAACIDSTLALARLCVTESTREDTDANPGNPNERPA